MITPIFYLNDTEVNPPKNWQGLAIELNYGKDEFPNAQTVSITDFEWCRENYDLFEKHIADGLDGGTGIFEGPTLRIDFDDQVNVVTIFDGYIDLSNGLQIKDGIKIISKSVSVATVDWLNDVSSFSFEYLASLSPGMPGYIGPDLYHFMPYVNNSVPNYEQSAMLSLMIYSVSQSVIKEIEEISDILADVAGYFTTIPAIIKFIIKIAYLIALILVLIKLVKDCIKFIISPVKYHCGMYVRDLMAKGAEYLNMKFDSDIFAPNSPYYNEFIIPEKLYNPPSKFDSSILGFLAEEKSEQFGYYKQNFSDLLNAFKIKYNAKLIVTVPLGGATNTNYGTITLIRKDKSATQPVEQLPDIYVPEYSYNSTELVATTIISYKTDSLDLNTLQNYQGTNFQIVCQPKVVVNRPYVTIRGYSEVDIPFARAATKTDLTYPERIIKDFLTVFDDIANAIILVANAVIELINTVLKAVKKIFSFFGIKIKLNPIPKLSKLSLESVIENRKGMLMLSSDFFNVPKIFILVKGSQSKYNKIHPNNDYLESGRAMWDQFYYVNSFIPTVDRPTGNQYLIKTLPKVPFNMTSLLNVIENNRVLDPNGNEAIIESLKFNPYNQQAEIKVRYAQLYTNNLVETYLEPSGN